MESGPLFQRVTQIQQTQKTFPRCGHEPQPAAPLLTKEKFEFNCHDPNSGYVLGHRAVRYEHSGKLQESQEHPILITLTQVQCSG